MPSLFVDETKVCSLTNGRYLVVPLTPGQHKLRSSSAKHGGVEQEFKADHVYYFRVFAEVTGAFQMTDFWTLIPVPYQEASVELKSLKAQDGETKPLPAIAVPEDLGAAEAKPSNTTLQK